MSNFFLQEGDPRAGRNLLPCLLFLILVQEPGASEHPAARSPGELGLAGQVPDRLRGGVQRDHRTHLQVRLAVWFYSSTEL